MLKKVLLLVFLLVMLCWPAAALAQFIGYISGQTVQQKVFTNQAANGFSATLTNIGNASHFLSYCNTNFSGTVSLQASPDGTFSAPITLSTATYGQGTPITPDTGCHVLQAGGYFPTVRAAISNYTTGSVNAWYSASGIPIVFAPAGLGSNGPTSPIVCDHFTQQSISSGSIVVPTGNAVATAKIYVCQMTISFSAPTSPGSIDLVDSTDVTCATATPGGSNWHLTLTANTPQVLTFGSGLGSFVGTVNRGRCLMITVVESGVTMSFDFSYAQF